jgi:Tfp pilus assembly protein PilZ
MSASVDPRGRMHVCASHKTALRIEFESQADFQDEYVRNLSIGGVFVETSEPWEVQTPVCIQLALVWCGEQLRLDGEVVHCLTPEMAAAGGTPGVALQLNASPDDLREQFSPYLNQVEPNEKKTGIGRRESQRAQARVIARVMEDGKTKAEYRTRDISTTGALLADEGRPLPVGTSIDLAFEHPVTGETLEVAGLVVRHVQSDSGGISGMGVQFVIPDARQAEVSEFLSDVRATEHSRQLASITGPIDGFGVESLLKMFALTTSQGTLTLTHGATEGFVAFENGIFLGAELADSTGFEALATLLTWSSGRFELEKSVTLELPEQGPVPLDVALWEAAQGTAAPARTTHETEAPASAVAASEVALAGDRVESCDVASDDDDVALDDDEIAFADDDIASDDSDIAFDEGDVASDDGEIAFDDGDIVSDDGDVASDDGDVFSDDYDEIEFDLDLELDFERESQPEPVAGEELQPPRPAIAEVDFSRLSPTATLSVDQAAVDDAQGELDKIEEALVDLASVGMTVAKAVDVIPEPDDDVYRALAGLADQGLVKLAD